MSYKIKYIQAARQDIKDAKSWYKKQLKGLQKRFSADVKNTLFNCN
jgi:hypothetical protein